MEMIESDSDEENDKAAAVCKRRKLEHSNSSSSLRIESRSTVSTGPPSAARDFKSPASPSAHWQGMPGPLAQEPPILLEGNVSANSALMNQFQELKEHNAFLSNEMAKISDQMKSQQDLMVHMLQQFATYHKWPQFARMPPLYNPLEEKRPRPGAKDAEPARRLEPLEMGMLRRQIYEVSNNWPAKREGFRRIVDPVKWHSADIMRINLDTLNAKTQWKLWHYAFDRAASLQTVMTANELTSSDVGKKQKSVGLGHGVLGSRAPISVASHEQAERTIMAASCSLQSVAVGESNADYHASQRGNAAMATPNNDAECGDIFGDESAGSA